MYEVEELNTAEGIHLVRVTLEMSYRDWLKLQKSTAFHSLKDYLLELEKTKSLRIHPMA